MNDSRSVAREHFRTFSEVAISSAALVYFIGFVYLYYYYVDFGVSLFAMQVSPHHILTFAYNVLTHKWFVTVGFVALLLLLTAIYETCIGWLDQHRDLIRSDDSVPFSTVIVRGTLRRLLPLLGSILVIAMFPLSFWWAHGVARDDIAINYQAAHEGWSKHLSVVEVQTGVIRGTDEFDAIVDAVNKAGSEGRAIPIAESVDRLFILVGTTPHGADDPMRRLPGDAIYVIEKSDIAVKEAL